MRPIALLTDFGTQDAYAGVVRGVILARAPGAPLFDLTHGIAAQDVRAGALHLAAAAPFCPADTVFVAVVDPGVGSPRRPVLLRVDGRDFVGPDNGLTWLAAVALGTPEAWVLDRPEAWLPRPGPTFHGRDVFAPVAAALAAGAAPPDLGSPVADPVQWTPPEPLRTARGIRGEVLLVDGYGNAVTNLRPADLVQDSPGPHCFTSGHFVGYGPQAHYGAVPVGQPAVVLSSFGYYELAVHCGHAARAFGLAVGSPVLVT